MPDTLAQDLDTGYYVYAVVPADLDLPRGLRGLDDAEVELVAHEGVAAVVGRIALDRPSGRRTDLLAHSQVVDRLAEVGAVVPVQFGSVMDTWEGVVADLLEVGHDRFLDILADLRGRRQLNLRASYVEEEILAEVVAEQPDIAELRRRTKHLEPGALHPDLVRLGELVSGALEHKRAIDSDLILEVVEPLVVAVAQRPAGELDHVLDVALLVAEEQIAALEEALEGLAEAVHERMRLRLVGPVAPYDFVTEDAWA